MNSPARHPTVEGNGSRILDRVQAMLDRHPHPRRPDHPCVTLTYAQSIDGCIAAQVGASTRISNNVTQVLAHQLRAMHQGILVGISTVLVDDPLLTVRHVTGDHPRPIILDSQLRTPVDARLLRRQGARPIIATTHRASVGSEQRLSRAGATVLRLAEAEDGGISLPALCQRLLDYDVDSVMIEGGARVITSVLRANLADQLVVAIAPQFLGGMRAVTSLGEVDLAARPRLKDPYFEVMANDLVVYAEFETSGT